MINEVLTENTQLVKAQNPKRTILVSLVGILCALMLFGIGVGLGAIYTAHQHNTTKTTNNHKPTSIPTISVTSTSSTTKHGSEVISLDSTYNKYLNYDLGISITFSKNVATTASCSGTAPQVQANEESIPVQVYSDTANNKIYIAADKYATTKDHQISPGVYQGMDSCIVNNTSLSSIKNGSDNLDNHDWIESMVFTYGKVTNAAGLDSFVKPLIPDGMVIDHMATPSQTGNVYTYPFKYVGNAEASPPEAHWYYLLYDPTKQLALFWITPNTQSVGWADIDSSGNYLDINPPYGNIIDQQ